ncbi:MAG: NRDE family protein [Gemmatales bacterium]|nr:NRDE family protein [Gemmatales bacterium]MDW8387956.1 NRDE family protein [Gemmatales bacterium]
MCLLAMLSRVAVDAPLIVAANREEEYDRGGTPPQRVAGPVQFVAGLDPRAGGTWFGVNEASVIVAVVNRPQRQEIVPQRSRGLLAKDMLACRSAAEAVRAAVEELGKTRYAPCFLVAADLANVFVIQHGEWVQVLPLPIGIHVLTRQGINATSDPRAARALAWLESRRLATGRMWLELAQEMCGDTGDADHPGICWRSDGFGTVSSTLLALRQPLESSTLLHAQGPPDRTPYQDFSHLLRF